MSWSIFKRNMSSFMADPKGVKSPDAFAQTLATEYDAALKRGYDQLNFIPIIGGNVDLLTSLFSVTLQSGNFRRRQYDVMAELGKGVILYWTTVQFNSFPPPIIPAPGYVSNISIQSSIVISSGLWTPTPSPLFLRPSRSSDSFIDNFITSATKHLQTVSGNFFTISLSPVGVPGPGILPWTGYFVP